MRSAAPSRDLRCCVVMIVGVMLAASVCASTATASDLPAGWIYIEAEGIDTISGAYHDRTSGLFVRSDVTLPGVVKPWAETNARRSGATSERGTIGELSSWRVTVPTGGGCSEVVVTLARSTDSLSWNLGGVSCGEAQRKRLLAFLEELPRRVAGFPGPNAKQERLLKTDDTKGLAVGAGWGDIRKRLGPPGDVAAASHGGFVVAYEVGRKRLRLHFDQQQTLSSIETQG